MDAAAWAGAAAAIVMCAGAIGGLLARAAYRDGKVDEILGQLTKITDRHDDQIRELQSTRRR